MTGAGGSERPLRAAVITISSSRAAGSGGPDESGDALAALVESSLGGEVVGRELIADDRGRIEAVLRAWCDGGGCDLILTTGGTGVAASDITPEATDSVIERRAPGIAEAIRAASAPHTVYWMLSRGVSGIRGTTLIVNFPGSPRAIAQTGAAVAPALPHAVGLLRGRSGGEHGGRR